MEQGNMMFMGNQDNSYTMVDLYQNNKYFGYKDSYNYCDIDVDNIFLIKSSYNEYFIRYYDVNKMIIVPLQLKIKNSYGEIHIFENNNEVMYNHSDDIELFRKYREIWNKIAELIGINNPGDFVETTLDDDTDEFITADVYKNTSFVKGNYRYNKVLIVLLSVFNDYLQTSLVQHKYIH